MQGFATSVVREQGVAYSGPGIGTWEPTGPRAMAFTTVIVNSDATGTNLGTTTMNGRLAISADEQSFIDEMSESQLTIRDAAGAVIRQIPLAGFPAAAPAGTPTS